MDSSTLLGSVEIDVRANLDKLVADFARGRAQTQAFAGDMNRVVGSNNQLAGSTAVLSTQLSGLVRQYDPLRVAQQSYTQDVATLQKAQKAGLIGQTEALALQGAMGRAYQDTEKRIEGQTVGLEGWARSTEHHLRAMRLLLTFVGVDLVKRLAEFAIKTLDATAAIKDQADQLGLTTAELQEYKLIAGQVGMTSDEMVSAFSALNKNLEDLSLGRIGPFSKLVKDLGVNIKDAAGNIRPTGAIFSDLIDKLGRVGNTAQQKGAMLIAFGEAGAKMGQLVKTGSTGVDQLREAVKNTGMVLSDAQIQQADQTAKKLDMIKQVLSVKFASVVVDNAAAISTLADAFASFVSVGLERIVTTVTQFINRMEQLRNTLAQLRQDLNDFTNRYSLPGLLGADAYGNTIQDYRKMASGTSVYGYGQAGQSVTVPLPPATPVKNQPSGNIDLGGLLSPKGSKPKQPKFDEFARDMDKEMEQQLQLEHDATGDLLRQNEIDKQLIDLKLAEQIEQFKRQVHDKQLTSTEGKKLIAAARTTAAMEKEAADRKLALASVEQQAKYADEIEQLTQNGLTIAKSLARTDQDRRAIDLLILDSKQRQAVAQLQTEITDAQINHEATREAQLRDELNKLRANQLQEIKQFDVEHLTGIDKFKNDLPKDMQEFDEAMRNVRFDLFNQKLQEAAQFASDIGDAFGNAVDVLITTRSPLQAFTSLVTDLAKTFNKAVIEEPLSNLIKNRVGIPAAQQVFGKQLTSLSTNMSGVTLTTHQLDTALAQATASLYALQQAAMAAAAAQGGGAGAGGLGSFASSLFGSGGGGVDFSGVPFDASSLGDFSSAGAGLDFGVDFGSIPITGFAGGGFTGQGGDDDVAGVVHKNEWVWDSPTTRKFWPVLQMIGTGQIPNFQGPGFGQSMGRGADAGRPIIVKVGDLHLHGVTDDRSARQSGRQALSIIHRGIADVARKNFNR